jgi:hypothetical protein
MADVASSDVYAVGRTKLRIDLTEPAARSPIPVLDFSSLLCESIIAIIAIIAIIDVQSHICSTPDRLEPVGAGDGIEVWLDASWA